MQVCLNGHVITDRFNRSPEFRKNFCTQCGERTITKCPTCNTDIPGDMIYDSIVVLGAFPSYAPRICANCGQKFPWTDKLAEQEEERQRRKEREEAEKEMEKKMENIKKIEVKIEGHGNIVNLGNIIDSVINNTIKLTSGENKEVGKALEVLAKAIGGTNEIIDAQKQKYLEQIKLLSEEALKPVDKRLPKAAIEPIITYSLSTLGAVGSLAEIWNTWGPVISSFFLGL